MAAAWAQGITGKNITTAIMDDGVDYMHPDLINNYVSKKNPDLELAFCLFMQINLFFSLSLVSQNARASYDFSSNDPYPYPRYTDDWFNR